MAAEKLHAITAALDAWEVARACLWHRINKLLATKGTTARLREKHGARARLPKPPAGVTLTGALSALRVAARGLSLHLDVNDFFPWVAIGDYPLTLNGFPTAASIEYDLQRTFSDRAAEYVDADFWKREIVTPTMKHAEDMRAALRAERAKTAALVELKTPLVEMLQALDRLGRANAADICAEIKATVGRNVNPISAKRPLCELVKRGLIQSGKGRNAEYRVTPIGQAVLQSLPQ